MNKKLTRHGNSLALIIDKPLLEVLKINEKTTLEISIEDNALVIRPLKKSKASPPKKEIDQIAERIMDKYQEVFKKLAKS